MKKLLVAVTAFLCCVGSTRVAHAVIVNIEYIGFVNSVRGNANPSLVGQSYTANYVFDTSDPTAAGSFSSPTENYVYGGTMFGPNFTSPALSASITIGAFAFIIPDPHHGSFGRISGLNGGALAAQSHQARDPTNSLILYNQIFDESGSPSTALLASITTPFTYSLMPGDMSEGDYCFGFDCYVLSPQTITETVLVADTPLPAALPLFATGLGAWALLGWHRKRKQAA